MPIHHGRPWPLLRVMTWPQREGGVHPCKLAASPEETLWSHLSAARHKCQILRYLYSQQQNFKKTWKILSVSFFPNTNAQISSRCLSWIINDYLFHSTPLNLLQPKTFGRIYLEKTELLAGSGSISAFNRSHLFIVRLMIDSGFFFFLNLIKKAEEYLTWVM